MNTVLSRTCQRGVGVAAVAVSLIAGTGVAAQARETSEASHAGMTWVLRGKLSHGLVDLGGDTITNASSGDTPASVSLPILCLRRIHIPDAPEIEFPPIGIPPDIDFPEIPKFDPPRIPTIPEFEWPPLPDMPEIELPPIPTIPEIEWPPLPDMPEIELTPKRSNESRRINLQGLPEAFKGLAALTKKVRGARLTSRAVADNLCSDRFGAQWRMAERSDGLITGSTADGIWHMWARVDRGGDTETMERFWVAADGQAANCWD